MRIRDETHGFSRARGGRQPNKAALDGALRMRAPRVSRKVSWIILSVVVSDGVHSLLKERHSHVG
jgi:hypothetical protein